MHALFADGCVEKPCCRLGEAKIFLKCYINSISCTINPRLTDYSRFKAHHEPLKKLQIAGFRYLFLPDGER